MKNTKKLTAAQERAKDNLTREGAEGPKYQTVFAAQERAKDKLTRAWQSAYELQESISTLAGLTRRGIAEVRYDLLGSIAFPRVSCWYRLKK